MSDSLAIKPADHRPADVTTFNEKKRLRGIIRQLAGWIEELDPDPCTTGDDDYGEFDPGGYIVDEHDASLTGLDQ